MLQTEKEIGLTSKSFENYASLATDPAVNNTELAGRYAFQKQDEENIIPDIAAKLDLSRDDSLLEIGCGPGDLLLPLSQQVRQAAGIDHPAVLERLAARDEMRENVTTFPGNFLTMDLPKERFSKVLIYSVLHYMPEQATAEAFVRRALSLLKPVARLLLGDLPNRNKKERFLSTETGQQFVREWDAHKKKSHEHPMAELTGDSVLIDIDDAVILSLVKLGRELGYDTYLLPQPLELPFCHTREDILFVASQ